MIQLKLRALWLCLGASSILILSSADSSTSRSTSSSSLDTKQIECPAESLSSSSSSASIEPDDSLRDGSRKVYIAGLAADASELKPELLTQLLELNCRYFVSSHVLTRGDESRQRAFEIYNEAKTRCFGKDAVCADFDIDLDPPGTKFFRNRIDRIGYLRDSQREHLRSKFQQYPGGDIIPGAIILADMDIYKLPTNEMIMSQTMLVLERENHHVICSAGLMHHPFGYYDIFATVLEPHTFPYPIAGRLIEDFVWDEDFGRIRSDDLFSEISQKDTLDFFRQEGSTSDVGTVLVKSCFGGLAIYRASTWLVEACNYSINPTPTQMRYSNIEDTRPCEHIIFHECLQRTVPSARIFVQPEMTPWWDEPVVLGSHLFSGGIIRHGIVQKDGLVVSDDEFDPGLKLSNGDFSLHIDVTIGSLVVMKETPGKESSSRLMWRQKPDTPLKEAWKYLFLVLEKDGELTLSQQSDEACPDQTCYQPGTNNEECKPCRTVIWTNGIKSNDPSFSWILHLGKDGVLRIVDVRKKFLLWESSTEGRLSLESVLQEIEEELVPSRQSCISSGTQDDINKALVGRYSEAILCKGSVFELSGPVVFTSSNQRVYTQGFPTDDTRAKLVISDQKAVTAIEMINMDHISLSNVIVDGNRKNLGSALGKLYGDALVRAGGESRGQVIRDCEIFDTRSWTTIHLAEGHVSDRCIGALVERNIIRDAGTRIRGGWASGIAVACTSSHLRNNVIVDATHSGIAVIGAPGSSIEQNHIIASKVTLNSGISLGDFYPYKGNFSGVVVTKNIVESAGATIGVAFPMGVRISECLEDSEAEKYTLYGAKVVENVVLGDHMQYGFAVDGVQEWEVDRNIDKASHRGSPQSSCYGRTIPSPPSGFQINMNTSFGSFQSDFKAASLEMAVRLAYEDSSSGECIPSGDQNSISDALTGIYADASLCPGAIFELTGPVVFGASHQRIYTQGFPSDDKAVLRIVDRSVVTAVMMYSFDRLELRNVIIDGNRKGLGMAEASSYGNPLIKAGGESRGQIVHGIHAFDPRGWAVLHFAEGDPIKRCSSALIESNVLGPAGGTSKESLASGLALACMTSIARRNTVIDTTATGIGVFGCPGSLVENNVVIADSQFISGGINLVDFDPFSGSFNATIVRHNTVHAKNSLVRVGVAMGFRNWQCMDDEETKKRSLWGATVMGNTLEGEHMRYGFAVNGVRNFTVVDNVDRATHGGASSNSCPGRSAPSTPSGFQVDSRTSSGNFQPEFEEAVLDIILRL